jgi:hypothetical protein
LHLFCQCLITLWQVLLFVELLDSLHFFAATPASHTPAGQQEDLDLIWSPDFTAALRARQLQRVAEAAKREEVYKQQLRDLMVSGGGGRAVAAEDDEEDNRPRVEYLGNADDHDDDDDDNN